MKIFFNYSDLNSKFQFLQEKHAEIAINLKIFDKVFKLNKSNIDIDFYKKHKSILQHPRGAGYWLWKPYFINYFLNKSEENDIIVYADSSIRIDKDLSPLFEELNKTKGVMTFISSIGNDIFFPEKKYTKRDTFVEMGCDDPYFYTGKNNLQYNGAFLIVKNNNFSKSFINEWLNFSCNEQLITDLPSKNENFSEFKDNRHDQSILSLLSKKHNLYPFPDPTQWGNEYRGDSNIIQFLSHLR